ncbi:hypothetical protein F383_28157 [Gossypium arboreum]|uniref:Uncharacterized protein n=1 Tax=Gossypium arboreum TaxID=29729 RepID=A0A0B0P786_GOSAR|nr:hypothetical protein F383_28157 [Gossypium arboreum]
MKALIAGLSSCSIRNFRITKRASPTMTTL